MNLNALALENAIASLAKTPLDQGGIYPDCGDCVDLALAVEKFVAQRKTEEDRFELQVLWRFATGDYKNSRQLIHCCAVLNGIFLDGSREEDPLDALWTNKEAEIEKGDLPDGFESPEEVEFHIEIVESSAKFDFLEDDIRKGYSYLEPLVDPSNQSKILNLIEAAYVQHFEQLPKSVKGKQATMLF